MFIAACNAATIVARRDETRARARGSVARRVGRAIERDPASAGGRAKQKNKIANTDCAVLRYAEVKNWKNTK